MSKDKPKVPASTEVVRSPLTETVDAAPNAGCVIEAAPTVDAGKDTTGGHWIINGYDANYETTE